MLRAVEFTGPFVEHLSRLGLGMVPKGTYIVDDETEIEPPMNLYGIDIWAAPARIGAFTYFGPSGHLHNAEIGRYCSVGDALRVGATQHPVATLTSSPIGYLDFLHFERYFKEKDSAWNRNLHPAFQFDNRPRTRIGNDVWIGADVYIKDGITVGDGAVIGAHAVVTKDVPAFAVVAGVPAKIIRYRFSAKEMERLNILKWWKFNLFECNIDIRDIGSSLSWMEDQVAAGLLKPYLPSHINIIAAHDQFMRDEAAQGGTPALT